MQYKQLLCVTINKKFSPLSFLAIASSMEMDLTSPFPGSSLISGYVLPPMHPVRISRQRLRHIIIFFFISALHSIIRRAGSISDPALCVEAQLSFQSLRNYMIIAGLFRQQAIQLYLCVASFFQCEECSRRQYEQCCAHANRHSSRRI